MADGQSIATGCRLSLPTLRDFAWVAERMRPDEIDQWTAKTGAAYHAEACAMAMANTAGPHFALVDAAGYPVGVGGFDPVRPGVYECWAAGTLEGWDAHWRAITLTCARMMRRLFADGAHRIQTTALSSRTRAHEWYERGLSMHREGEHPGWFADGATGITFARTR